MTYEPAGVERRIQSADIKKRRPGKYTVIGYGPGRTRVHTERGLDAVKIHGGVDTEVSGYWMDVGVEALLRRLVFRTETIPESGAKILHITGE